MAAVSLAVEDMSEFFNTLFGAGEEAQAGWTSDPLHSMPIQPHVSRDRSQDVSLGIQLDRKKDGDFFVAGMANNGGAKQSGQVEKGDRILSIDGQSTEGMQLAGVLSLMMGPVGSSCPLILSRKEHGDRTEVQAVCERLSDGSAEEEGRAVPLDSFDPLSTLAEPPWGAGNTVGGNSPSKHWVLDQPPSEIVMAMDSKLRACASHRRRFEKLDSYYRKQSTEAQKKSGGSKQDSNKGSAGQA